jgi:hypothetical protein
MLSVIDFKYIWLNSNFNNLNIDLIFNNIYLESIFGVFTYLIPFLYFDLFILTLLYFYLRKKFDLKKILQWSIIRKLFFSIIFLILAEINFNLTSYLIFFYIIFILCLIYIFFFVKKDFKIIFDRFILFLFLFQFWSIFFNFINLANYWIEYNSIFSVAAIFGLTNVFLINYFEFFNINLYLEDNNSINIIENLNDKKDNLKSICPLKPQELNNKNLFINSESSSDQNNEDITITNNSFWWERGAGKKYFKPFHSLREIYDEMKIIDTQIDNFIKKLNWSKNNGLPNNFDVILSFWEANLINISKFNYLLNFLIKYNSLINFDNIPIDYGINKLDIKNEFFKIISNRFNLFSDFYYKILEYFLIIGDTIYFEKDLGDNWLNYSFPEFLNLNDYIKLKIENRDSFHRSDSFPIVYDNIDSLVKNSKIHPQIFYYELKNINKLEDIYNNISSTSTNSDNEDEGCLFYPSMKVSDLINPESVKIKNIKEFMDFYNKEVLSINYQINKIFKPLIDYILLYLNNYYICWAIHFNNTSFFLKIHSIFEDLNLLMKDITLPRLKASCYFDVIYLNYELIVLKLILAGLENYLGIDDHSNSISETDLNLGKIFFIKFWIIQLTSYLSSNIIGEKYTLNWLDVNIIHMELLENLLYCKLKLLENYHKIYFIDVTQKVGFDQRGIPYIELIGTKEINKNLINYYNDLFEDFQSEIYFKHKRAYDLSRNWVIFKTFPYNYVNLHYILYIYLSSKELEKLHKFNSTLSDKDLDKSALL